MNQDEFQHAMLEHMEKQTNFLAEISKAIGIVMTISKFLVGAVGMLGGLFGLVEFFKQLKMGR